MGFVDWSIALKNVILSAEEGDGGALELVLGGVMDRAATEAFFLADVELFGDRVTEDEIRGILANLYDVEVDGECAALSVGLILTAEPL